MILKFTWNFKRPKIVQTILKRKKQWIVDGFTFPNFKANEKAIVIKTVWY